VNFIILPSVRAAQYGLAHLPIAAHAAKSYFAGNSSAAVVKVKSDGKEKQITPNQGFTS